MKKRTKVIMIVSAAALLVLVLAIAFFNSDVWKFLRYKYDATYVPPAIETVLLHRIGVEEGELLPDEELKAFFDEFDGHFDGYYDSMPESLRRLTESFAERVNARYKGEVGFHAFSVSTINVKVSIDNFFDNDTKTYYTEGITFGFVWELSFRYEYTYSKETFVGKEVCSFIPSDLHSFRLVETDEQAMGLAYTPTVCWVNSDIVSISYTPEKVSLCIWKRSEDGDKGGIVKELPTADFDEYMRDAKDMNQPRVMLDDKLSMKRIEKYIASKRK